MQTIRRVRTRVVEAANGWTSRRPLRSLLCSIVLAAMVGSALLVAGPATTTGATVKDPPSGSSNYDWAKLVLEDGGWPTSTNNVTTVTRWMTSEEPSTDWWDRNNPLNNGLGSGGGAGLGSYTNLVTAAYYVAANLQGGGYGYTAVTADFARSAAPATTAQAIWDSTWASSHYGHGANWFTGTASVVTAPQTAWGTSPLPAITSFTASPSSLSSSGGTVTFSVLSPHMTSFSISSSPGLAGLPAQTTAVDVPANTSGSPITYTFTVTTHNSAGTAQATAQVTEAAGPPAITSFTASPSSLSSTGGTVTFSVVSPLMTSYSISSSLGITGLPAERSTITVPPNTTSSPVTYTFTVTVHDASGTAQATTEVVEAPPGAAVVQRSTGETDVVDVGPNGQLMFYVNRQGTPAWNSEAITP